MRKILLMSLLATFGLGQASAQYDADDLGIFNHVSLGVGVGTTGISIDVAAPITPYVAVRGGVDIMPSLKYKTDLDVSFGTNLSGYGYTLPKKVEVEGKLKGLGGGHVLFDFFPSKNSSFHITAGAYFSQKDVINIYNTQDGILADVNTINNSGLVDEKIGLELGDYLLTPDARGNVNASIKTTSFRPYVGLGFGRPVPMKHRFTCNFDLGVQLWGKPAVYLQDQKLEESKVDSDTGAVLKYVSKVSVWPVLNLRLVGRIL